MPFNSSMLRLGRLSRDKTQSQLALELKTTQGRIAKWEDSLLHPSDPDIRRIAEVLRFPVSFFEHEMNVESFGSCCVYHRKRQSIPAGVLNRLHAQMNIVGLAVIRMHKNFVSSKTQSPLVPTFPNLDIDEYGSGAEIASLMRGHWKIPPGRIQSLVSYVESAGGIVIPMDFQTDKLDAVSLYPLDCPPLFFINRNTPADRWRFTLSHEVGHIVMHRIPSANAEVEADEFASELLLPTRELKGTLKNLTLDEAARLKLRWRVSMQAIIRKAKTMGDITDRKYRTLFMQLSKAGGRKREPVTIESEKPQTVSRLISYHQNDLKFTDKELHELLFCLNSEQMQRRFGPVNP